MPNNTSIMASVLHRLSIWRDTRNSEPIIWWNLSRGRGVQRNTFGMNILRPACGSVSTKRRVFTICKHSVFNSITQHLEIDSQNEK